MKTNNIMNTCSNQPSNIQYILTAGGQIVATPTNTFQLPQLISDMNRHPEVLINNHHHHPTVVASPTVVGNVVIQSTPQQNNTFDCGQIMQSNLEQMVFQPQQGTLPIQSQPQQPQQPLYVSGLDTSQPVFYGLETVVQNTVMSQQFMSKVGCLPGLLAQNSYHSATTQVFQTSTIEPVIHQPDPHHIQNCLVMQQPQQQYIPQLVRTQQPAIITNLPQQNITLPFGNTPINNKLPTNVVPPTPKRQIITSHPVVTNNVIKPTNTTRPMNRVLPMTITKTPQLPKRHTITPNNVTTLPSPLYQQSHPPLAHITQTIPKLKSIIVSDQIPEIKPPTPHHSPLGVTITSQVIIKSPRLESTPPPLHSDLIIPKLTPICSPEQPFQQIKSIVDQTPKPLSQEIQNLEQIKIETPKQIETKFDNINDELETPSLSQEEKDKIEVMEAVSSITLDLDQLESETEPLMVEESESQNGPLKLVFEKQSEEGIYKINSSKSSLSSLDDRDMSAGSNEEPELQNEPSKVDLKSNVTISIVQETTKRKSTSNKKSKRSKTSKSEHEPKKKSKLLFKLQSQDGLSITCETLTELWQKMFDLVQKSRKKHNMSPLPQNSTIDGYEAVGLKNQSLKCILDEMKKLRLASKKKDGLDSITSEQSLGIGSDNGSARCTPVSSSRNPSDHDMFSWLASKHRQIEFPEGFDVNDTVSRYFISIVFCYIQI